MTGIASPWPVRAGGDTLPVAMLLVSCTLWGLMWWPLKAFADAGIAAAPLTTLAYGIVGVLGLPWLLRQRASWRGFEGRLLALAVVGGSANIAFVQALMAGEVVRVMLLFYLSPVWSVLGGRWVLGERITPRRALAVVLALAGAVVVIGVGAEAWQAPFSLADGLGLYAGFAFAANNILARWAEPVPTASKSVAVLLGAGAVGALAWGWMAGQGALVPVWPAPLAPAAAGMLAAWAAVLAFGAVWVLGAMATWQYGVSRLEAGRSGVILIAELLVAVLSAVAIGGESLAPREWIGGALILAAALLEALAPPAAAPGPAAADSAGAA